MSRPCKKRRVGFSYKWYNKLPEIEFSHAVRNGKPVILVKGTTYPFTLKGKVSKCFFKNSQFEHASVKLTVKAECLTKLKKLADDTKVWLLSNKQKFSDEWQQALTNMHTLKVPWNTDGVGMSRNLDKDFSFYTRTGTKGPYTYKRAGGKKISWEGKMIRKNQKVLIRVMPKLTCYKDVRLSFAFCEHILILDESKASVVDFSKIEFET